MAENLIKNVLGSLTIVLALSACSTPVQEIDISATPTSRPQLNLPPVDELNLRRVEWFVITRENAEEKFRELEQRGIPVVFFAITGEGYEHLSLNLSDVRAQIEQLNSIIVAYERYYQNGTN